MNIRHRIALALKKHNIRSDGKTEDAKLCVFNEGVTNKFFSIQSCSGVEYVIRMNGKLWPPFTRLHENKNLKLLRDFKIDTTVVENDHVRGFQICKLQDKKHQFNEQKLNRVNPVVLKKISAAIKLIHNIKYFKNQYFIDKQVTAAYSKLSKEDQRRFETQYIYLMRIQYHLCLDTESTVSSHNDLLPSSVYISERVAIVDWEYAGLNHRAYDLALFSIKSNLHTEDQQ